jgi:hypothetical protein
VFFAITAHFRSTGISTRQHTCEIGVQKRGPPFRGDRHLLPTIGFKLIGAY